MPNFGAFAAIFVCCRGDLRSPADEALHKKRAAGRWLAAAETAELIAAGASDPPYVKWFQSADAPKLGIPFGAPCRVVEDADPYAECGADSPKQGN